ncbi:hypothetical protein [Vampirovibrio chlorellavorus]|uniref:hypothetical protein n=1 Tax=Vampirovibrio chlorellavorus TaxID=758823 RepID=UPI0026F27F90|nr:hypothetical protein [Vampirovibrio chlorellavorus]
MSTLSTPPQLTSPWIKTTPASRSFIPVMTDLSGRNQATLPTQPAPRLLPSETKHPVQGAKLAWAGLLFALGLATHHFPGKAASASAGKFLFSPDWKSWARVGLGVATVGQLNQAFQWKPPAWLTGLESAAVITPMALRFNKASGLTLLVVAPLVATAVQTNQWAQKFFVKDLKEYCNLPESVSRLGVSLSVGGLGVLASLLAHRQLRNLPVEKLPLKNFPWLQHKAHTLKKNLTEVLGTGALLQTCPRGCSPSIICMSEIGEMVGGLWQGHQQQTQRKSGTT